MTEQIGKLLGGRIRALRKKMGLKQAQFARLVGMSRDAIGLMERGEKLPRLESICKISDTLNISASKLLDFDKSITAEKKTSENPLSSLTLYLKTKSPNEIQMIHDIAKNIFDKNQSGYKHKRPSYKSFITRDK